MIFEDKTIKQMRNDNNLRGEIAFILLIWKGNIYRINGFLISIDYASFTRLLIIFP